jgi:hypothetical protein
MMPLGVPSLPGIQPLKLAIKKADIQTIITSKKFIKKLQGKGFDLSVFMA